MKKIVMMFAVAAMMVACGNGAKTATQEQKDSIKNALYEQQYEAAKAAIEAPVAPEAIAEDAADDVKAAFAEAQAVYEEAVAKYNEAVAAINIDSTTEAFKAEFDAAVKAFEEALNKPAEEAKAEEQPAEEEQK